VTSRVAALGVGLVFLGGCTHGPAVNVRTSAAQSTPTTGSRTSSASPASLEAVTLLADFSDPPSRWELLATIPFGPATAHLGYLFVGSREGAYSEAGPASFAIDADGSIWVLDIVKRRLARYSPDGAFLGAVPGLHPLLSQLPFGQDVAISNGRMYVLQTGGPRTTIRIVTHGVVTEGEQTVTLDGQEVVMHLVFPSPNEIVGAVAGLLEPLGSGSTGFAELDLPGAGSATLLPGAPVGPSRWIDVVGVDDRSFEVHFSDPAGTAVQPIRVATVLRDHGRLKHLDGFIGAEIQAVFPDSVGLLVGAAAVLPRSGENVEGTWYLQVSSDGHPLIWERVPEDGEGKDIRHLRTFVGGPDDAVYQMRIVRTGVQILRRPP